MILSENKVINFIMLSIIHIFAFFAIISLMTDNKLIFDITKGLFIIVGTYVSIKAIKDFIKGTEKNK